MDLTKRDSEQTKKQKIKNKTKKQKQKQNKNKTKQNKTKQKKPTNRFSNDIGHVIGDKVRLNGSE